MTEATIVFRARLLLVAAAIGWSLSGLIVKHPLLQELPADRRGLLLAFYRAFFATIVLSTMVRRKRVTWTPKLVPMAVAFALMNLTIVVAITRTTAAAAIFLQYTSTGWAFLFAAVFLKERISRGNLVALSCAAIGIVWIVSSDLRQDFLIGNLLALSSGFMFGAVVFSLRQLRDHDSAWLTTLNHGAAALLLLPLMFSLFVPMSTGQWLLAILLGVVQMGLPYLLFARGVRHVSAQEAALITLLEPVLNPIWVLLVWNEPVPLSTWIGGGFIVGGLALRYLFFAKEPGPARSHVSRSSSSTTY